MEDVAKDYHNPSSNRLKNFISNLSIGTIIIFGIIILGIIYISSNKDIDPKTNYVIYGILVAIILFLFFKPSDNKRLLTWKEAREIAEAQLITALKDGKIFPHDSKLFISDVCNLREVGSAMGKTEYVSWDIGFIECVKGTNYKKDKIIRIHPYFGIVIGIEDMPMGYTGREKKDIQYIPIGIFQGNNRATDLVSDANK